MLSLQTQSFFVLVRLSTVLVFLWNRNLGSLLIEVNGFLSYTLNHTGKNVLRATLNLRDRKISGKVVIVRDRKKCVYFTGELETWLENCL